MTTICKTCGKPDHSPYRVYDDAGRIINGCVAADHDGRLVAPSASSAWHARKESKQIRKAMERFSK